MINCEKWFSWLPISKNYDKVCHIIAGLIISTIGIYFFGYTIGIVVGIVVGSIKQVYDEYKIKGTADVFDFIATASGSGVAGILYMLLNSII